MEKQKLKSIIQKALHQGRKKEEILYFAQKNQIPDAQVKAVFLELETENQKLSDSLWYPWGEKWIAPDLITQEKEDRIKNWEYYKKNPHLFLRSRKITRVVLLVFYFLFLGSVILMPILNIFVLLLGWSIIKNPKEYKNQFENELIGQQVAKKNNWVYTSPAFLTQHAKFEAKSKAHNDYTEAQVAFHPVSINREKWNELSTKFPEIYEWQQQKEKILKLNRAEFLGEIFGDMNFKGKKYDFWLSKYKIRDFLNRSSIPREGLFLALRLEKPIKNAFEIETETSTDRFITVFKEIFGFKNKEIETESINFNQQFAFRYNGEKKDYEHSIIQILSPVLQEKLFTFSQKEKEIKPINYKLFLGGLSVIILMLVPIFFLPIADDLQAFLTQDIPSWQYILGNIALYILGIASILALFSLFFSLTWVPFALFILYKKIQEYYKKSLHIVFKNNMIFIQLKKPLLRHKKTDFSKSMEIAEEDSSTVENRIKEVLALTVPMLKYLD